MTATSSKVSLFPSSRGWQFRRQGGGRAIRTNLEYRQALRLAIAYCRRNDCVLFKHRSDGTVISASRVVANAKRVG